MTLMVDQILGKPSRLAFPGNIATFELVVNRLNGLLKTFHIFIGKFPATYDYNIARIRQVP